ncbi:MAG: NUDIX hydrolase [Deltaproteobacteria bacterium]|nr:NUDIX hydrolase [Deltaproteobacteria bacterium]
MSDPLQHLAARYGTPRSIVCSLPSIQFPPVSERDHGEVCMAIRRPSGHFLLQTKANYPRSVMRLPSGGIHRGEQVDAALLREIWEETNLSVEVDRFVARISYEHDGSRARFCSYLFVVHEVSGELRSNDPDEKITHWSEALPADLPGYADALRAIHPKWKNWGLFRAAALDILFDYCRTVDG